MKCKEESYVKILKKSCKSCRRCELYKSRSRTVFSEGNLNADIVFVGEAPGREEDKTGRPFVGKAGQLLDQMIFGMGLLREDVYITNVAKCRPPKNRKPTSSEVDICINDFLLNELELVSPRIVVALGATATCALIKIQDSMSKLRGKFYTLENGLELIPTYHPAFLLRQGGKKEKYFKRLVWEDLKAAMDRIGY